MYTHGCRCVPVQMHQPVPVWPSWWRSPSGRRWAHHIAATNHAHVSYGGRTHAELPPVELEATPLTTRAN